MHLVTVDVWESANDERPERHVLELDGHVLAELKLYVERGLLPSHEDLRGKCPVEADKARRQQTAGQLALALGTKAQVERFEMCAY